MSTTTDASDTDAADGDVADADAAADSETEPASVEERARDALRDVADPCSAATGSNLNIVEMGLVKDVEVDDADHAHVEMRLTTPMCHMVGYFIDQVEHRLTELDAVESADLDTDDGMEWSEDYMSEAAQAKRQEVLDGYEERYREELADGDASAESASGESASD
ncbi:metal-sulfur cluster biosynthetic enzyme [Halarchaeum rubridurum]|uniref:Metal-sulfur cluster biosynthetic enzyme n=1 Tax=Halarchaeum rubridurum TaxID=489911 RepID=A0A830FZ78_9EURY|nr:metal-sulfur cluster assembly factor [Halarchaeum rubridurum]MBP1953223.1 metal-sulfur cluster biosynthetic enzyme [Halarchaeum rubridurum]GGM66923.1 hypothetical protein GCM10009017_16320 [Halarchaeum rubridurum]